MFNQRYLGFSGVNFKFNGFTFNDLTNNTTGRNKPKNYLLVNVEELFAIDNTRREKLIWSPYTKEV